MRGLPAYALFLSWPLLDGILSIALCISLFEWSFFPLDDTNGTEFARQPHEDVGDQTQCDGPGKKGGGNAQRVDEDGTKQFEHGITGVQQSTRHPDLAERRE